MFDSLLNLYTTKNWTVDVQYKLVFNGFGLVFVPLVRCIRHSRNRLGRSRVIRIVGLDQTCWCLVWITIEFKLLDILCRVSYTKNLQKEFFFWGGGRGKSISISIIAIGDILYNRL